MLDGSIDRGIIAAGVNAVDGARLNWTASVSRTGLLRLVSWSARACELAWCRCNLTRVFICTRKNGYQTSPQDQVAATDIE